MSDGHANGVSMTEVRITFRTALVITVALGQIFVLWSNYTTLAAFERTSAATLAVMMKQFEQISVEHRKAHRHAETANYLLSLDVKDRPRLRMPPGLVAELEEDERDAMAQELSRGRQNRPARDIRTKE